MNRTVQKSHKNPDGTFANRRDAEFSTVHMGFAVWAIVVKTTAKYQRKSYLEIIFHIFEMLLVWSKLSIMIDAFHMNCAFYIVQLQASHHAPLFKLNFHWMH